MTNPWDRQENESDDAWECFRAYRDDRKPRKLLRTRAGSAPTERLSGWYRDNIWRERVMAWDKHLDSIFQQEMEDMAAIKGKEIAYEQLALLKDTRDLAIRETEKLLASSKGNTFQVVKTPDLIRLIDRTITLSRLVAGESTSNVEVNPGLSKLSIDELRTLNTLHKKAASGEQSLDGGDDLLH